MAGNLERVGVEFVVEGVGKFVGEVTKAEAAYDSATGKFATGSKATAAAAGGLATAAKGVSAPMLALATAAGAAAVKIGEKLFAAIGKTIGKMGEIASSALMLAGKFQEMEFASIAIGRAMGVTDEETRAAIGTLNDAGIRYDVAAKSVAQLTRNQIDLASSLDLARIAQATGILVGEDSSATMERITYAITTGNTVMLRRMGIFSDAKKAEEVFAAGIGKTVEQLTQQERMTARVNDLIENSAAIMGVYDAAMQSPTKQLRSLTGRIIPEFLAALGAPFQSAFFTVVKSVSGFVTSLKEAVSEGGALYPIMVKLGAVAGLIADGFAGLVDMAKNVVTGFSTEFLGGLASTAEGALRWGVNIVAQLASGLVQGAAAALTAAMNFIAGLLKGWMSGRSPPKIAPDIDAWGADAMTEYLKGFTEADFSVLNQLQSILSQVMGEQEFADISKEMIVSIGAGGEVDEAFFDEIAAAAGEFGQEIADLARLQFELADAERQAADAAQALEDAQAGVGTAAGAIAALTQEYNDMLRAGEDEGILKAKLAEINAAEDQLGVAQQQVKAAETAQATADDQLDTLSEEAKLQGLLVDELLELLAAEEAVDDMAGSLADTMDDVAAAVGGVGDAMGDITAGMPEPVQMGEAITDTMSTAIDDAKKLLEEKFADIFAPLTTVWEEEISPILEEMGGRFDEFAAGLEPVWDTISWGWDRIKTATTDAWDAITEAFAEAKIILEEAGISFEGTTAIWEFAGLAIQAIIIAFVEGASAGIELLGKVIAWLVVGIAEAVAAIVVWWEELKGYTQEMVNRLDTLINNLVDYVTASWTELVRAVKEKAQEIYDSVTAKITELLDWFIVTADTFVEAGRAIVQGIIDGISDMYEALKEKIRKMAADMFDWFKQMLGIDSPSAVAAEIGRQVVEGFVMGIDEMARLVVPDIPVSLAPMGGALLAMGRGSPAAALTSYAPQPIMSQSVQVPIGPVYINSGMDEAAFQVRVEQAVMRALGR